MLATAAAAPPRIDPAVSAQLANVLGDGRLAIADPQSVPLGIYGRAALTALGLWPVVAGRLAPARNARQALAFVEQEAAPVGLLYLSDVVTSPARGSWRYCRKPPTRPFATPFFADRQAGDTSRRGVFARAGRGRRVRASRLSTGAVMFTLSEVEIDALWLSLKVAFGRWAPVSCRPTRSLISSPATVLSVME